MTTNAQPLASQPATMPQQFDLSAGLVPKGNTGGMTSGQQPFDLSAGLVPKNTPPAMPAPPPPDTKGMWGAVKRVASIPGDMYHAFTNPASDEEKQELLSDVRRRNAQGDKIPEDLATNPSQGTLVIHRMLTRPSELLNAKSDQELATARKLWEQGEHWKGANLSASGAVDKILSAIPFAGPMLNQLVERGEGGLVPAVNEKGENIPTSQIPENRKDVSGMVTEAAALGGLSKVGDIVREGKALVRGGEAAEGTGAATPKAKVTNPVEATVTKNVAKAKLPAGENLAEEAQTHLEDSTANEINRIADSNGVPRPKPGPAHQMQREIADSIYKRSKAEYAEVDAKTGGKFQPNADALANVNNKLRDIAGTDDAKEIELGVKKTRLLWQQDQLFAEAEKNGLPKETVTKARNDFHTAQAQYDLSNNLRASAPSDNPNALDATKMRNRMNKMNITEEGGKPGRLTQAVGKESAANLEENAHAVQFMSQLPATEARALTDIVGAHTKTSLLRGGATDWKGVMDDFDKMGTMEQRTRFADPEAVRSFLRAQARKQLVTKWGTRAAVTAGAGTVWHKGSQL